MAYTNYYPQNYFPQRQDYAPQMQAQMPPMQQPTPQPIMRFVTSRAEAEVAQIPFDGSAAYFVDTGSGKIYAKALRQDGTAPLIVYEREAEATPDRYVTQQQFDILAKSVEELKKAVSVDE